MPGDLRTQIGFITFDSTVHFYNLKVNDFFLIIYKWFYELKWKISALDIQGPCEFDEPAPTMDLSFLTARP